MKFCFGAASVKKAQLEKAHKSFAILSSIQPLRLFFHFKQLNRSRQIKTSVYNLYYKLKEIVQKIF